MSLVGGVAARLARRRLRQIRAHANEPQRAQDALLRRLCRRMAATSFGREHALARVRRVADLSHAVPLCDYAGMEPWWQRARRGEPDVCWPGVVRHWAISSGTTSGEKFLPVSAATIRSNRGGGFDALVPHLAARGGGLFGGKLVFLGGCTALRREGPVYVGDNTGIMARHVPRWLDRYYAPDAAVRAISDWEQKVQRAAAATLASDVRMVAGVPSWIVLWAEEVLRLARAQGRPARTLFDVWPRLQLFVHGGVSFAPYRTRTAEVLGAAVACTDTYSASEGGMLAVQDDASRDGMVPLLDRGAVFEFVPVGELGSASPRRFGAAAVETGVDYAVALTTNAGMAGYLLGDTVRFESTRPLRLVFAGRLAQTLNAFGEHVSGGELERAIAAAAAATGACVTEFAVMVRFPAAGQPKGQHVFLVEFQRPPTDHDAFAVAVDRALAAGNEDYATHRVHGLRPPLAVALRAGAFVDWMRRRGKVGGQNKVPRVLREEQAAELHAEVAIGDA